MSYSYVEAAAAKDGVAVTPSDDTVLDVEALWIGTGGDVSVVTRRGTSLTFTNVPDGTLLPIAVSKVMAATDADDIVGLVY